LALSNLPELDDQYESLAPVSAATAGQPAPEAEVDAFYRRVPGNMDEGYADQHRVEHIVRALGAEGPDVVWHGPDGQQVEVAVLGYAGPAGPGGVGLERGEPGAYVWADGFDLPLALVDVSERGKTIGLRSARLVVFDPDDDGALAEVTFGPGSTELRIQTTSALVAQPDGWLIRWARPASGSLPWQTTYFAAVSDACVDDAALFEITHGLASHAEERSRLEQAARAWARSVPSRAPDDTVNWGDVAKHLGEITVPDVLSVRLIEREQLDVTTFENDLRADVADE